MTLLESQASARWRQLAAALALRALRCPLLSRGRDQGRAVLCDTGPQPLASAFASSGIFTNAFWLIGLRRVDVRCTRACRLGVDSEAGRQGEGTGIFCMARKSKRKLTALERLAPQRQRWASSGEGGCVRTDLNSCANKSASRSSCCLPSAQLAAPHAPRQAS